MRKEKFKIGDLLVSDCGDHGLVLDVGPRPDDDGTGKTGVNVLWANESLAFWMNMDEPTIKLKKELVKND